MKRTTLIIYLIAALIIGLTIGYFIFSNEDVHEHKVTNVIENGGVDEIWTCSMHPQIRQNEPGLCPICEMDLIPLQGKVNDNPLRLEMTNASAKLANIQTYFVTDDLNQDNSISLAGVVKEDERRISSIVSHVPGRIEKLYISFAGQELKAGQRVAKIYSPELISAQRELIEARKFGGMGSPLLEAAKNKLKFWKVPEAEVLDILENGVIRETFHIYANATGVVKQRRVAVGDYLKQGESILEVVDLNSVWVVFEAYESDISEIKLGQDISFTTPALNGKSLNGKINFIDPILDASSRSISVRVETPNRGGLLKPGMLVTGSVFTSNKKENITVPKSAVLWTGKRSVVYIKVPDKNVPLFEYREVELGHTTATEYEILSGLEKGEEVVVNGSFSIDAAAQLNNQTSMMHQEIGVKQNNDVIISPNFQDSTPEVFKLQIAEVLDRYLKIKDALVESDLEKSKGLIPKFIEKIESVDMMLVKDEAHDFWIDNQRTLFAHAQIFERSENIDMAREQFYFLSKNVIMVLKAFGAQDGLLFVQYCPMAFNNKGADWISKERAIRNPYFGDRMLKCGSILDSLN